MLVGLAHLSSLFLAGIARANCGDFTMILKQVTRVTNLMTLGWHAEVGEDTFYFIYLFLKTLLGSEDMAQSTSSCQASTRT